MSEDNLGAEIAKSTIRHLVTVSSGALLSAGVITNDQSTQYEAIAGAILLYLIGQGWSWVRQATKGKV